MSIEIEILNGDESWSRAEGLFKRVWPAEAVRELPWGHIKWADAELRVMIEAPDDGLACHVGIYFRNVSWNGRNVHIGGIGGVATRPDCRRRGYASLGLNAAVQTMRDHDAAQFALLFCEPEISNFIDRAVGSPSPVTSTSSSLTARCVSRSCRPSSTTSSGRRRG